MTTGIRESGRTGRRAFTLIELLVVIAIIGILVALLFPALNGAINKARRVKALAEVKNIALALQKYNQEYASWPNTTPYGVPDAEAKALPIRDRMVRMLRGENDAANNNTKELAFMEFSNLDSAKDPISPWGSKNAAKNTYEHYYYVKFDTDFNNVIAPGAGGPPDDEPRESTRANIIVWTYNPKEPKTKPEHVIGSWSRQ
jgi:prepilin-type N-terminal cleavage/methylation domain-containing protein